MEEPSCKTYYTPVFDLGEKTHMIKLLQGLVNNHVSGNKYKQEIVHFGKKLNE